jgi:MOSC domain-containing protein YiiM
MGRVASIVYTPRDVAERRPQDRYARVPLERATLVERRGIQGDAKNGTGDRQINVMVADVLEELSGEGFKTGPGELGEQIVLTGIPADALTPGTRLRLGEAVIEVTIPRTGCARFEMIQGHPKQSVQGRLGVLAKVVTGGEVRVGDVAEVVAAEPRG